MKVNTSVEPLVRETFAAVLAQDANRSGRALRAISDAGEQVSQDAVNLSGAVAAYALFDLHGGYRPSDEQLRQLAESFTGMVEWPEIDQVTALNFLTALADQQPISSVLPEDKTAWVSFNIGVWLLAAFGPDERKWYQYLDQIVNSFDSASPTG